MQSPSTQTWRRTFACVRCGTQIVCSGPGDAPDDTEALARTMLCHTCRLPDTDEAGNIIGYED